MKAADLKSGSDIPLDLVWLAAYMVAMHAVVSDRSMIMLDDEEAAVTHTPLHAANYAQASANHAVECFNQSVPNIPALLKGSA